MGPAQRQQRRLALCRWVHSLRAGYWAARRDHPAGRRLERHSELRVGGAASGTTWLVYYRSREVISVARAGGHRGAPARRLALRSRWTFLLWLSYTSSSALVTGRRKFSRRKERQPPPVVNRRAGPSLRGTTIPSGEPHV